MIIYTVKQGDTISSVAREYNVAPELISSLNDPPDINSLVPGQKLVILVPETVHKVSKGETLYSIGRQYNISVWEILLNNPYIVNGEIYPGQELVITYKDTERSRDIVTNGYAYTFTDRRTLLRTLPYLTYITVFAYGFDQRGKLVKPDDDIIIKAAYQYNTAPIMLISSLTEKGTFSNELVNYLMGDEELQDILLDNILNNIRQKGYMGLDIDFEYIPPQYTDEYAAFIKKAADILNQEGYICTAALAPKTSAEQSGLLYEAHNYNLIGAASNHVLIMTYEWGYAYGPPMAVAPVNNVESVIKYAVTEIPADKIFMGVPMYGYDWRLPFVKGETKGISLSPQQALYKASKVGTDIMYDNTAQSPYYYYTSDNKEHVVWFEDGESINAKMDIVEKYGLKGCGFWSINRYFPQCWLVINNRFNITKIL